MSELPTYVRAHAGGASLQVKVLPRASRNEIGGVLGDRLTQGQASRNKTLLVHGLSAAAAATALTGSS